MAGGYPPSWAWISGVSLRPQLAILQAVTVVNHFGTNAEPDSHTFRVEHGKIRYVHTITACKIANCGLKLSPEIQAQLGG